MQDERNHWQRRLTIHEDIAAKIGATRSRIPGLWVLPNGHELTSNQLLSYAAKNGVTV